MHCSVRTAVSIYYFPKIYLCYFSLFNVYFFSFPFGFSYVRATRLLSVAII